MINSETQQATALLKVVKISPSKLSRVTRAVTGMGVEEAIKKLTFTNLKAAGIVKPLIVSAIANAENNNGMDIDNLFIRRIDVGKAMVLKRLRARARGRGARILKRFSKIRVVLEEKE